jgi:hypothetical protein
MKPPRPLLPRFLVALSSTLAVATACSEDTPTEIPGAAGASSVAVGGGTTGGAAGSAGGVVGGAAGASGAGGAAGASVGGSAGAVTTGGTGGSVGGVAGSGTGGGAGTNGGTAGGGSGGAAGAAMGCPRACGPTYEQFFDETKLATIRITLPASETGNLDAATYLKDNRTHCKPFNYRRGSMEYEHPDGLGDITLPDVGVRARGSRDQPTQGLKLDVQTFYTPGAEGNRRFADLNRVNILSLEGDSAHMLQCLGYRMMRDVGIPAPRCNFVKVFINDDYYGLLENVEQVNKGYVRRRFGNSNGFIYAGSPSQSEQACGGFSDSRARLQYSGDSWSSYSSQYLLVKGTSADAMSNLVPMLKCGDATQTPDDNAFRSCISDWIDVQEWLRVIAAETVMPELESFIGYYRNIYLYFKPDPAAPNGGKFVVWPWDIDTSFNKQACYPSCTATSQNVLTSVSSFYGPAGTRAPLVQRLTTVFRAEYCAAMTEFASVAMKPSTIDAWANVMEPGMSGEPNHSSAEWQMAVSKLRTWVQDRAAAVPTMIQSACQ